MIGIAAILLSALCGVVFALAFASIYISGCKQGMTALVKELKNHDLYVDIMVSHNSATREIRYIGKQEKVNVDMKL